MIRKNSILGLKIKQPKNWKNIKFSESFSCSFKILGKKTIVIEGNGYANYKAELESLSFCRKVVSENINSPYIMIQNWDNYKNSSGKARNAFIQAVVSDKNLEGIVFCNGTLKQELSVLFGQRLGILNLEIRICKTYHEAVIMASRFETLGQLPKIKNHNFSKLRNKFKYNEYSYKKPVFDLLKYLNSIDWSSEDSKLGAYRVDSNHPLLPVFDALTLIKSQLNETTKQKNNYMKELVKHQEHLEDEIKDRTKKIVEGEQLFFKILEYSPTSSFMLHKDLSIKYVNKKAEEVFGYNLEDLQRPYITDKFIKKIESIDNGKIIEELKLLLPPPQEPDSYGPVEVEIINKNGDKHITEMIFTATEDGYLLSIIDITIRKKEEEKLYIKSITDPMTKFYNRRYFQDYIEKEFNRSKRFNHKISLIIFDVDFFKKTNDLYGHLAGDSVLYHLADVAREYFRRVDLLFRIGGEEFAVLLPETSGEDSFFIAERFRNAVENSINIYEEKEIKVSISLGVAELIESFKNIDELIKSADTALYEAKENGRNRTVLAKL